MDLDNPSYFSVAVEHQHNKMKNCNSGSVSSSSECSLSRQLTPPRYKINLRTFGRSISANSNESSHFLRGEPRLSDLAPELAAKHISRQNAKTTIQNGVVYSSLAIEPDSADSGDEVFIEDNTARYYNVSGGRRHSIGAFSGRERAGSLTSSMRSFKEDLPSFSPNNDEVDSTIHVAGLVQTSSRNEVIDDHSIRHGSYPRKRCNKCVKGTFPRRTNMDDILITSSESSQAASSWVQYFTTRFQQIGEQTNRKAFKIHHLAAEDFIEARVDANVFLEKSSLVKLQLVVVCPGFLEYISEHADHSSFGKLFLPDRTLALLLGVSDDDITDTHRKVLPTYFKWDRMVVGQDKDESFAKEFIGHAMAILARVWKHQSSVATQEKSCFSVSPKKIRQGQSTVFILLTHPLQKEDTIKISVEKNNEMIEVEHIKRRNPYTMKISVPDSFTEVTAMINILVEKNGSIIGSRPIKCESRLRELEQVLRLTNHPVEFMCQTLGFSPADKENLDNWLVHNFQKNMPPHFNLLASHNTPFAAAVQAHKHSHQEFPTLLHFAAKFGLEKLALQLLDCPGSDVAGDIKNLEDLTPAEIADRNNHSELAASLRNFMNMNEVSNMYSMYAELKAFSSCQPNDHQDAEPAYLVPRNHDECYNVLPPPRPVTLKFNTSPSSTLLSSPSTSGTQYIYDHPMSPSGYTPMNIPHIITGEAQSKHEEKKIPSPVNSLPSTNSFKPKGDTSEKHIPIIKQGALPKNLASYEDKVQTELLEIINDFKNNVHSISQVEKLVEEWKNRSDVQKSFKEKQEQLKEMQMRYERIQQEMKSASKKPSPFDRFKKLFVRHKSHEDPPEVSQPVIASSTSNLNIPGAQAQRPVSSLSTSSSNSSGRMSTISGCSLGDSGTHSDNEERKNSVRSAFCDDFRNDLNQAMMNLHYPPLPNQKHFKNINSHKTKLTTTIEETTCNQIKGKGTPSEDRHYIHFPPSGLPVPDIATQTSKKLSRDDTETLVPSRNEYMNVPASGNTAFCNNSTKASHEYMNFKTPNSIN